MDNTINTVVSSLTRFVWYSMSDEYHRVDSNLCEINSLRHPGATWKSTDRLLLAEITERSKAFATDRNYSKAETVGPPYYI